MSTATLYICDICKKEEKEKLEFSIKVCRNGGELIREMDLCMSCHENLDQLLLSSQAMPEIKVRKEVKEPQGINLLQDIFFPVLEKIKEQKDALKGRQRKTLHAFYVENWLKDRFMEAVGETRLKPQLSRKGPDVTFYDKSKLLLKGGSSFGMDWIVKEGVLRYHVPALFLASGADKKKVGQLKALSDVKLLAYEYVNDGEDDWIAGMVIPR